MFYYSTFLWLSLSAGCCDSLLFLLFDFTFFTIIACINRVVKTRWDEICSSSIIINIIAMGIFSISFQTPTRSSWIVRKFSTSLRIFLSCFYEPLCVSGNIYHVIILMKRCTNILCGSYSTTFHFIEWVREREISSESIFCLTLLSTWC